MSKCEYRFGLYLRDCNAKGSNLDKIDLSLKTGMCKSSLDKLESGNRLPHVTNVADLIDAYGADIDEGYWLYFNDYIKTGNRSNIALVCISLRMFLGYNSSDMIDLVSYNWNDIENGRDLPCDKVQDRIEKIFGIRLGEFDADKMDTQELYERGRLAANYYSEEGYKESSFKPHRVYNTRHRSLESYDYTDKYPNMHLANLLRDSRINNGIGLNQIADYLGYTSPAIVHWENGKLLPNIKVVPSLADAYDIPIELIDKAYFEDYVEARNVTDVDRVIMLAFRITLHSTIRELEKDSGLVWMRTKISQPMSLILKDRYGVDYSQISKLKKPIEIYTRVHNCLKENMSNTSEV